MKVVSLGQKIVIIRQQQEEVKLWNSGETGYAQVSEARFGLT